MYTEGCETEGEKHPVLGGVTEPLYPLWSQPHFAMRESLVSTAQPRFTRHLVSAAPRALTDISPHRAGFQRHHACKVLSMSACWRSVDVG